MYTILKETLIIAQDVKIYVINIYHPLKCKQNEIILKNHIQLMN